MPNPHLKLHVPQDDVSSTEPMKTTVRLGDMLDVLRDAIASDRIWVEDFAEDTVEVSQDFYEVLVAYQEMVRRAA